MRRDVYARGVFVFVALIVPTLIGYVVYHQVSTPTFDCAFDRATGIVLDVPQDSFCNYAGLQTGDVILNVNGIPLNEWKFLPAENQPVQIQRGAQRLTLELPLVSLARVQLLILLNAILVTLVFWCAGTLLLWRRYPQFVARLFFLLTQSLALGLLFFLAYPDVATRPAWMTFLISVGFHLGGALAIHFYLNFPRALGTPRQRRWLLFAVYALMLVALACRLSGTDWGVRATFFLQHARNSRCRRDSGVRLRARHSRCAPPLAPRCVGWNCANDSRVFLLLAPHHHRRAAPPRLDDRSPHHSFAARLSGSHCARQFVRH